MHWTDQFASSGPVGTLVHGLTDPISGQPDLKGTPVRVSAIAETWRGTLMRLCGDAPQFSTHVWWAKTQIASGYAFELAGWAPLEREVHSESALRRLLEIPRDAELVSYSDPRRAIFRYAGMVQGRLAGCVFFGPPDTDFAGAGQAKMLLGREIGAVARISLLAGLDAAQEDGGKTICACFSVGEHEIQAAIKDQGLRTPASIGALLKAGTNCGSCIPELQKLIGAAAPSPVN
jgi:assimilatory nitrate reductase catalytic subunit